MCGIVGICRRTPLEKERFTREIEKMSNTLTHRGPDGEGTWISPDGKVGFGHKRLSIIDLSDAGLQPMSNPEGSIWVTYNGEIYNHREIRRELESKGYVYRSHTDTETIIYAYQEWGMDCLHRFNGMFAIGLWDNRIKKLFLIRDRVGIKPVHYYYSGNVLLFASEVKALIPIISSVDISKEALYHFLSFGSTPAPFTLFENILKIPAGHYLSYDLNNRPEVIEWWNPLANHSNQPNLEDENSVLEHFDYLLTTAVSLRTLSDVPYGAFLSGGVDSSLITALMTRETGKPVDTYSIAIGGEKPYSELGYADIVAQKYNSRHFRTEMKEDEFLDFLKRCYINFDEPLTTQDFIPLFFLSKYTRDNNTIVIQVGEGSDELFLGYEGIHDLLRSAYKKFRMISALPGFARKGLLKAYSLRGGDIIDVLANAVRDREFHYSFYTVANESEKGNILRSEVFNGCNTFDFMQPHYDSFYNHIDNGDISQKFLYMELKHRLPELLLMRVDRMGMANSIEPRVPFLDYRIVEFAFKVPMKYKLNGTVHKYLVKKIASNYLPEEIVFRKKSGFFGSTSNLMNRNLQEYAIQKIHNMFRKREDLFNPEYITNLKNNPEISASKIWSLLNFSLWYDNWIDNNR